MSAPSCQCARNRSHAMSVIRWIWVCCAVLIAADRGLLNMDRFLFAADTNDVTAAGQGGAQSPDGVDYIRQIKPLLREKCYACHGVNQQKAGLRSDTAAFLLKGGESGPVVVPGRPEDSLLIGVLTGEAGFTMPPKSDGTPLTSDEVALVAAWIRAGASAPEDEPPQMSAEQWWSYQPNRRPELPAPNDPAWCRGGIDRFVAARRDQQPECQPVPEADRDMWLRRVHLDLIGLPPTREELLAFRADKSPDAFEKVVDDLLLRPQYGERWGRHWMDIWRYSDWYGSRGINEIRYSQRHIWRWRDWIVRSLNEDLGYDQMVVEMLAADEVASDNPDVLPATGYLGRNWYKFDRNVWMFDTVERTGEAFLGLTLRCCRCHDHKYDPVTQQEYYQFRAFFEPHDVRTDPVSALTPLQKDATLGQVLTDGIALVYDKHPDAPTYRFQRGDSRFPDESTPLSAGVPAALGGALPDITPVKLPPAAFIPALRTGVRESWLAKAATAVEKAQLEVDSSRQASLDAERAVAVRRNEIKGRDESNVGTDADFLHDRFESARPDDWQTVSGQWAYEDGHLIEKSVGSFATVVSKQNHPENFKATVSYRTLQPGTYRSVGFSFDYIDQGNSQDVYTSTGDASQSVQAFHRLNGQQHYPSEGIVPVTLKVGDITTVEVEVRGSSLTIDLNGERKLNYVLPVPRRPGRLALWVHAGSAEFHEVRITELTESLADLERKQREAAFAFEAAVRAQGIARADLIAIEARLAAQAATAGVTAPDGSIDVNSTSTVESLKKEAVRSERVVDYFKAQAEVASLEYQLDELRRARMTGDPIDSNSTSDKTAEPAGDTPKAEMEVAAKLQQARQQLIAAESAAKNPEGDFTPVGDIYPSTSTGRRTALARWIASPANPRTARVAVNHIWNRHFGRPLVATTENFGMNGARPTHPELLDWLASELIANEWRMKPLHRAIVLSSTYRLGSGRLDHRPDPATYDDVLYWRSPPRRMEAEQVRDSLLHLAGKLDLTPGGPEIVESSGETSLRRSLYFRNTPNEKMLFLETFDVADPNACYRRKDSVIPHQALALMNSGLAQDSARIIAERIAAGTAGDGGHDVFISHAFQMILSRDPSDAERDRCVEFLISSGAYADPAASRTTFTGGGSAQRAPSTDSSQRARENLIHVLLLHNDFVTIR